MADRPDNVPETHYEWLLRRVERADRRATPFTYGGPIDFFERREWDIKSSGTKR